MSRENLQLLFGHHRNTSFYLGAGIVALSDEARIWLTAYPKNKKCASFIIVESYWNLKGLRRSSSIFKTTKYIVLVYTNTYNCTYTTFCFKNELWNSNTEKGCRSKTTGSYINYTWDQGLTTVTLGPSPAFHAFGTQPSPFLYILSLSVLMFQWQELTREIEAAWLTKPKILIIWTCTEKLAEPLQSKKYISILISMSRSNRDLHHPCSRTRVSALEYLQIIFDYSNILLRSCAAKTS